MTDNTVTFWNKIADRYSKKPVADEAVYLQKLALTREHCLPHMNLLEFGCGTGTTALALAPYVNHVLALDFSQNMIDIAQSKKSDTPNVVFELNTIEEFKASDETYDIILGFSVLHLVGDKEAVIKKVYNMLKPGGVFVSSTACIGDTMAFFKWITPLGMALGLLPQLTVFKRSDLEGYFTLAGFTIMNSWQPGRGKAVFIIAQK